VPKQANPNWAHWSSLNHRGYYVGKLCPRWLGDQLYSLRGRSCTELAPSG